MKRNILYISPNFNYACGVSKHVFTLLNSEELNKRFNLHFITNKGDALQKLENAGIRYTLMEFKTDKVFHFDFFRNLKLIKDYCKEKKIDIVHSHHRYPEYLSNNFKNSLGIKTVATVHNMVTGFKIISYKSDIIIAISNSVKNHLQVYYKLIDKKIEVMYNCLSSDIELKLNVKKIKSELGIPNNSKVLLYAGRNTKEKGITVLLKAFNTELDKFVETFLILIGCEQDFDSLNNKRIIFLPAQESITKYYLIADLLLLPSFTEGLGYTMLESGVNKVPFIGSRAGGIAEFIEDGVNGYLFDPGDAVDLARKIKYVLDHPKETSLAAEKLHQKVLQECNCDKYFRKLTDIYTTLLAHR